MTIKQELIDEIEVLLRYNLDTTQEGIKVHNTARQGLIDASERLFEKGLVSQKDGGYLTDLGHEAAEHTQAALRLLSTTS
ncbi:TIGR02647 family protein [Methylophaga sp. 42_25_T18]|nr:TIGR02647 family protein [Methylophaga sp. 42_25_T18]OUR86474.1 TIGR02647 family protein [Methylophaga sp. 42_8_T64]